MTTSTSAVTSNSPVTSAKNGAGSLGMADFIKLLTTQLKMQDPTAPADNKEMIAQMAQFSSLSGIKDVNTTLSGIADKLDKVLAAQAAATPIASA